MLQAIFPLLKKVTFKWCSLTKLYQPCDIKIIAALKKYLYLSDVLDFYKLGNTLKAHKKKQANRLPRVAEGGRLRQPCRLARCSLSGGYHFGCNNQECVQLYKSQLVTLRGGVDEKFDIVADLLCSFKALID